MNALKHGLASREMVLPGESRGAFRAWRSRFIRRWQPRDGIERGLLRDLAGIMWRLRRCESWEADLFRRAARMGQGSLALAFLAEGGLGREMEALLRAQAHLHRQQHAALRELIRLRSGGLSASTSRGPERIQNERGTRNRAGAAPEADSRPHRPVPKAHARIAGDGPEFQNELARLMTLDPGPGADFRSSGSRPKAHAPAESIMARKQNELARLMTLDPAPGADFCSSRSRPKAHGTR
jgi:hypothetical protein